MIAPNLYPQPLSDETIVIVSEYLQRIADEFHAMYRDRIRRYLPDPSDKTEIM